MNEKFEPKLSGFGLAKFSGLDGRLFAINEGTAGYIDPEYISDGVLSSASDVYSFGIVVLQLLSRQKVLQLDLEARHQLTRKVSNHFLICKKINCFFFFSFEFFFYSTADNSP